MLTVGTYLRRNDQLRNSVSITQYHKLIQPPKLDPSTKFHFSAYVRLSKFAACMTPFGVRINVDRRTNFCHEWENIYS